MNTPRGFERLRRPRISRALALLAVGSLAAGLAAAQPFECSHPGNQLANCAFDTDLSGWTLISGQFAHQPADGSPQPGSLEVASVPGSPAPWSVIEFQQIVSNLIPARSYDIGIRLKVVSGTVEWCSLHVIFAGSQHMELGLSPTSAWAHREYMVTPVQGSSVIYRVACHDNAGLPFSLRFDDALVLPITWGADVGASLQSCKESVTLGGGVTYSALVSNRGPVDADVDVVTDLPGDCRWTCDASSGAFCTSGPVQAELADAAYIPAGGSVSYEAACLNASGPGTDYYLIAKLSATVVNGYDPIPNDNAKLIVTHLVPPAERPHMKGDLTGDIHPDLLLRHEPSGAHAVWEQVGSRRLSDALAISPTPAPPWQVEGVDDFDGDRQGDLVLRDATSGAVQFWLMDGVVRRGEPVPLGNAPTLGPEWKISATADFNEDLRPDLVWRNSATQKIAIWTLNGTERVGTLVPSPDQAVHPNWQIVAALNYDGQLYYDDDEPDLLWYNSTSGRIVLWLMDAQVVRRAGLFTNPPSAGDNNWKVLASADYGVGAGGSHCTNDLVWRNASSGKLVLWYLDNLGNRTSGTFTSPAAVSPDPTSWTLIGPR